MTDYFETLQKIFRILGHKINDKEQLLDIELEHTFLRRKEIVEKLHKLIPKLKKYYESNKLTCLHINSLEKQKFPAINLIRQILKCNGFKLEPYVICKGYCKITKTKLVDRYFRIILL